MEHLLCARHLLCDVNVDVVSDVGPACVSLDRSTGGPRPQATVPVVKLLQPIGLYLNVSFSPADRKRPSENVCWNKRKFT